VVISSFPSDYLRKRVNTCYSKKEGFKDKTAVMANVALDWAIVLGYISSMISSLVSLLSTYLYTKTATFPIAAAIILIFIFVPTIWWVFSFEPGTLVSTYNKHFRRLTNDKVCDLILITTYVFLGISQLLATP
jgi:amino acid transporter